MFKFLSLEPLHAKLTVQNFAIRWRDLDSSVDIGGFVTIDGVQYGGRLIKSKSYAPAVFSRIQTSSMYSRPLSFPHHSPGTRSF